MELKSFQAYRKPGLILSYYRTITNREIDFILGDMEVAIEIKTSRIVHDHNARGLLILQDDLKVLKG